MGYNVIGFSNEQILKDIETVLAGINSTVENLLAQIINNQK